MHPPPLQRWPAVACPAVPARCGMHACMHPPTMKCILLVACWHACTSPPAAMASCGTVCGACLLCTHACMHPPRHAVLLAASCGIHPPMQHRTPHLQRCQRVRLARQLRPDALLPILCKTFENSAQTRRPASAQLACRTFTSNYRDAAHSWRTELRLGAYTPFGAQPGQHRAEIEATYCSVAS